MKKTMQPVAVEAADGLVRISQELRDLNFPDPEIQVSPEQVPLLVTWLLQASQASTPQSQTEAQIPVHFYTEGRETVSPDSRALSVFINAAGMVVLQIDESTLIEMSPSMAKRLREQLSVAVRSSMTDLFRPDAEA